MSDVTFKAFEREKYLSLETFRKSGQGVPTPVWFVQDGPALYISTEGASGKVKRIRNNARVRIAPCDMRGNLRGDWHEARASLVEDPGVSRRVSELADRKYGLTKKLFDVLGRANNRARVVLRVEAPAQS
jgi:uncharacterized protein